MAGDREALGWQTLREIREARGITQEAMAFSLGYAGRNTYSQKELGKRNMSIEEALRISRMLGLSVETLFAECE